MRKTRNDRMKGQFVQYREVILWEDGTGGRSFMLACKWQEQVLSLFTLFLCGLFLEVAGFIEDGLLLAVSGTGAH